MIRAKIMPNDVAKKNGSSNDSRNAARRGTMLSCAIGRQQQRTALAILVSPAIPNLLISGRVLAVIDLYHLAAERPMSATEKLPSQTGE